MNYSTTDGNRIPGFAYQLLEANGIRLNVECINWRVNEN